MDTKEITNLVDAIEELKSMAESLEIDLPGDAGYVEQLQKIIEFLDSITLYAP